MDFSYLDQLLEEEGGKQEIEETGTGYRNIWAVAETADGALLPASLEVLGQARELADQIGVYVYGILLGDGVESLGQNLIAFGADKVLVADDPAWPSINPRFMSRRWATWPVNIAPRSCSFRPLPWATTWHHGWPSG